MKKSTKKIILHAGEYCFDKSGTHVHTLLGSCVSITLWHPAKKIGGMCHYALPYNYVENESALNPRFGDDCLQLFKNSTKRHKTHFTEYEVKIFGGGNSYDKTTQTNLDSAKRQSVGEKNVAAAYNMLLNENANILVAHVGEFGSRRIIFDISTGDVWVRFTPNKNVPGDQRSLSGRQ